MTGFSVIVSNSEKDRVLFLAKLYFPESLLELSFIDRLETGIRALPLDLEKSRSVSALLDFGKFSIVPEELYSTGMGKAVLGYTARLAKGDHIYSDHWSQSKSIIVYTVPLNFSDWFDKRFSNARFMHDGTALEQLYQLYPKNETFALLNIRKGQADFYLAQKGQVKWYNKFPYESDEDILYYLLHTLEHNRFPPTELKLQITGDAMKGSKLENILSRYIGEVKELSLPLGFEHSAEISLQEMKNQIFLLGAL